MASTLAGLLTPITPSAGGEPTGPMMNFTLSWLTSRSAATLPPWPVYWSSYMISSSVWGLPPTLMPPAALRSATASSMPRWAARPQAVPPPDSGPMPPILTTSCACALVASSTAAASAASRFGMGFSSPKFLYDTPACGRAPAASRFLRHAQDHGGPRRPRRARRRLFGLAVLRPVRAHARGRGARPSRDRRARRCEGAAPRVRRSAGAELSARHRTRPQPQSADAEHPRRRRRRLRRSARRQIAVVRGARRPAAQRLARRRAARPPRRHEGARARKPRQPVAALRERGLRHRQLSRVRSGRPAGAAALPLEPAPDELDVEARRHRAARADPPAPGRGIFAGASGAAVNQQARVPDAVQRAAKRSGALLIRDPACAKTRLWTPGLQCTATRCTAPGERGWPRPGHKIITAPASAASWRRPTPCRDRRRTRAARPARRRTTP